MGCQTASGAGPRRGSDHRRRQVVRLPSGEAAVVRGEPRTEAYREPPARLGWRRLVTYLFCSDLAAGSLPRPLLARRGVPIARGRHRTRGPEILPRATVRGADNVPVGEGRGSPIMRSRTVMAVPG